MRLGSGRATSPGRSPRAGRDAAGLTAAGRMRDAGWDHLLSEPNHGRSRMDSFYASQGIDVRYDA